MKFKKTEINSLEDLINIFAKVENCPTDEKELIGLLKKMKKAGLINNLIDGAYYIRAFIASHDETLQYGIEEQRQHLHNKEVNPYKEKIELVHNYIKEQENWPKPEIVKEQSISLDDFADMLKEMSEEERTTVLSQLPEGIVKALENIGQENDSEAVVEE